MNPIPNSMSLPITTKNGHQYMPSGFYSDVVQSGVKGYFKTKDNPSIDYFVSQPLDTGGPVFLDIAQPDGTDFSISVKPDGEISSYTGLIVGKKEITQYEYHSGMSSLADVSHIDNQTGKSTETQDSTPTVQEAMTPETGSLLNGFIKNAVQHKLNEALIQQPGRFR